MPADRVPDVGTPLQDEKGNTNPIWWRFFARIAAQFSGQDAPIMPVDVPGLLSIIGAQAKVQQLTEAAVMEAAQQIIAALPRPAGVDHETADNALIALGNRPPGKRDPGALDLAAIANARIQPQRSQPPQILICTQATFPTLAGTGPTFIYVSDFAHWIYWDGTAASFADGGSDYYIVAAAAPSAIGWHAVDGSNVSFLNADGTLTAKTLKNVAGTPAYLKVGAGADTLVAPVAPTISGHTELAPTGITVSAAAAATVSTGTALAGATQAVLTALTSGGGGGGAVTDPQHQHNLTAGNAPISATGEPEAFYSTLWFRL